ncbi:hypothetical protein F2Q70_00017522 [Brassica cretica]|uniref:Uncharacterized protein n=2 Tax=Brassica cretica TaxID=69181 RepID=A0A3N6Q056_BRACR|nr:hypothetical protein F2Q70_00017522 [Brassica cretica]KAF2583306.1 hypothetical protein F2Q68_00004507 [Brassica cretica]KAF3564622.1 hypothetical protein DY000_02016270 [Brassica cretica]
MDNPVATIYQALDTRNASRLTTLPRIRKKRGPQAGTTSSGRVYNFDELEKLEEPDEEFLEILQAYQITTKR